MLITDLELVGFKCLLLKNTTHLKLTFTQIYQLILGTNGSGKSSVMDQLTPFPADPNDFSKEAFKAIGIKSRGSKYRLETQFQKKVVHAFWKDGENLNPGGTTNVQKQLVEQEFKITADTHELTIGRDRFTKMSPTHRREWFTHLSDVSYDYAIGVFNDLKSRSRDAQGTHRTTSSRLVTETAKIITQDEEDALQRDVERLERDLTELQSQRNPQITPSVEHEQTIATLLNRIKMLGERVLRSRPVKPHGPACHSIARIDEQVSTVSDDIVRAETALGIHVQEFDRLDRVVTTLRQAGVEGVVALQAQLEPKRQERDEHYRKQRLAIVIPDPFTAEAVLETVFDSLDACFRSLPANEDRRYSQARLANLRVERLSHEDALNTFRNELARLNAKREHMDAHKAQGGQTCPNCNHHWVAGFSDEIYELTLSVIAKQEESIKEKVQIIEVIDTDIEVILDYGNNYREFTRCVTAWPALKPLWDHLLDTNEVINHPAKAAATLQIFAGDLKHAQAGHRAEEELVKLQKAIDSMVNDGGVDVREATRELEYKTRLVEQHTSLIGQLRKDLSAWNAYRTATADLISNASEVEQLTKLATEAMNDTVMSRFHELLGTLISQYQRELSRKVETLTTVRQQRAVVKALEAQLKDALADHEALQELVLELSPTRGLIAEGMFGFIRNFTGQMNNLIRKIWSYPLQVRNCGSDGETADLDYKFPLMVQSKTNLVPDVGKASTGQQEIVNLSFVVVAMRYLGISDHGLTLDEFGASFDEAHRNSAMTVIKTLMESESFSQLFMVSHYEANHGALSNAEVLVLCAQNITVPSVYNQHAQFL